MWPTTKANSTTPVAAMTTFLPIVEPSSVGAERIGRCARDYVVARPGRNEMRWLRPSRGPIALRQDLSGRGDELLHVLRRNPERLLLVVGQADLDDVLDPARADPHRDADVEAAET